jgi:Tfp pilus assembly protein PilX
MSLIHRRQQGFSLVTAIFLLVVLAGLGAVMATFFTNQQQSSALDVMGSRAYQAARAGIEWAVYDTTVLKTGTLTSTTASATVTGSGTLFSTELAVGKQLYTASGVLIGKVSSIAGNTSLTLTANASAASSAATYYAKPWSGCATGKTFSSGTLGGSLSPFTVTVTCTQYGAYTEGTSLSYVYNIVSKANNVAAPGHTDYVERQVSASIEQ